MSYETLRYWSLTLSLGLCRDFWWNALWNASSYCERIIPFPSGEDDLKIKSVIEYKITNIRFVQGNALNLLHNWKYWMDGGQEGEQIFLNLYKIFYAKMWKYSLNNCALDFERERKKRE